MDADRLARLLEEVRDLQQQQVALYQQAIRNQQEAVRAQQEAMARGRKLQAALGIVIAIRLWLHKRTVAATLVASLLPLARPEGAFLLPLWAALLAFGERIGPVAKRLSYCALLAVGMLCWALFSGIFNHDLLYIYHSWFWPADSRSSIGSSVPVRHRSYPVRFPQLTGLAEVQRSG